MIVMMTKMKMMTKMIMMKIMMTKMTKMMKKEWWFKPRRQQWVRQ